MSGIWIVSCSRRAVEDSPFCDMCHLQESVHFYCSSQVEKFPRQMALYLHVVVWNPSACFEDSEMETHVRNKISPEGFEENFEVFIGQLRQLFGLKSEGLFADASDTLRLLTSDKGFTECCGMLIVARLLIPIAVLLSASSVAKSAFDKASAEHEDIYDAVGSEEPIECDHGVDLQQPLLIKIDSSNSHKK
ncbi:hypothetical protein OROMI_026562 [Orobanche minor]